MQIRFCVQNVEGLDEEEKGGFDDFDLHDPSSQYYHHHISFIGLFNVLNSFFFQMGHLLGMLINKSF